MTIASRWDMLFIEFWSVLYVSSVKNFPVRFWSRRRFALFECSLVVQVTTNRADDDRLCLSWKVASEAWKDESEGRGCWRDGQWASLPPAGVMDMESYMQESIVWIFSGIRVMGLAGWRFRTDPLPGVTPPRRSYTIGGDCLSFCQSFCL